MRAIDRIIIHHSASPRATTTLEQIAGWHRERGFDEIGYHLVIQEAGVVRAGRAFDVVGAHARGFNTSSVGVCVVGNNTIPEEVWSHEQIVALRAVVGTLLAVFPDAMVCGHRDVGRTECPGLDVRALFPSSG